MSNASLLTLGLAVCLGSALGGCKAPVGTDTEPGSTVRAALFGEPLDVIAPVIRIVAGEPDTLLAWDVFRSRMPVRFGRHPDVRVTEIDGGRFVVRGSSGFSGIALVPLSMGGADYSLIVESSSLTPVTFTFTPDATPPATANALPNVFVIGGFNDWSRTSNPLTDRTDDGRLTTTIPIAAGRYEYKFTVDGEEVLDPAALETVPNPFGAYNNVLTVEPVAPGSFRLRLENSGNPSRVALSVHRADADGGNVLPSITRQHIVALADNRALPEGAVRSTGSRLVVDLNAIPDSAERLRLAVTKDGLASNWIEIPLFDGRPLDQAGEDEPFVWQDAIIYQVVLDRFRNGDPTNDAPVDTLDLSPKANYQGGDLAGLLERLEAGYFTDLGVNTLWISPVYTSPNSAYREYPEPKRLFTGYHGYWPIEPRSVDYRLGDAALLKRVVSEAHERGLKVLLDVVSNHVHVEHPYASEHPDWFGTLKLPDGSLNLRRWDDYRLTTWFEPYMPSFDYEGSPDAVDQMTADAVWWLDETGADGIRHDAVKHIPNVFWRSLTERIEESIGGGREVPVFQIGETFGSYDLVDSYVRPGQLDAQFNFLMYDQAMAALGRGGSMRALADEMDRSLEVFGPLNVMGNLLESHDKPRFLSIVEGDIDPEDDKAAGWSDNPPRVDRPSTYKRMELGLAYLLTTPGVPVIYYGGEIGMTGANDPDNRRFMQWDSLSTAQETLRAATARLAQLRRDTPALRYGTFETLRADEHVWVFRRATPTSEVYVALNTGGSAAEVSVPGSYRRPQDALDASATIGSDDGLSFSVPAGGYRVIRAR